MDLSGGEDIEENMLCEGSNSVDNILKTNDISTQNLPNSEKNLDDYANSSDSLSSSVSLSDSDLTSTDSEDSLALSESESITDVTPLNSPYCDSPLYQNKLPEHKLEDRNINPRNFDSGGMREGCSAPVVNVLMQAIAKLEIEAKKAEQPTVRVSPVRRRTVSYGGEDIKKVEQENHRLFKRLISQQNRVRTMHSSTGQPSQKSLSIKHQDLVKSDGDISVFMLAEATVDIFCIVFPMFSEQAKKLIFQGVDTMRFCSLSCV
ncbi:uncharacterized protein CDAR_121071 [Caerostris darwini]|uniref:Uncharacterized protein n=1 Tax=Caerostris darwini TaxID=1538125 RepID=A0AAV4VG77_9ARAC|nr:uncharacterized protein CDAR_121071 [Caerostris darwini]